MTSDVDGTLSCVRSTASVGHPCLGFTLERERSKRGLEASSKSNSRCEGAGHHPAAEKRTPSTQAKAACRRTGRGRSVLRNTLMEMAAMSVRAAFARRTTSGNPAQMFVMERAQVLVAVDLSQNAISKLGMILLPVQGACGLHDALPRKGNDTLRLAFLGVEAEPKPRRDLLQGDHESVVSLGKTRRREEYRQRWKEKHGKSGSQGKTTAARLAAKQRRVKSDLH